MCTGILTTTAAEFSKFLKSASAKLRIKDHPECGWHYLLCCMRGDDLANWPPRPNRPMDSIQLSSACKGLSPKKRAMVFSWFGLVPS
jgi:hypothetical protein